MLEKELETPEVKELFRAICILKSEEECQNFFRDLCTFSELQAMTERFQVAKRVYKKEPYRKISAETGASTTTITRVAHWLNHGMNGYKLILERMKK